MLTTKNPLQTDQGRSVSRYASDAPEHREHSAKLLALLLCSLTGTLFLYQGQEIGMVNVPRDWPIESYRDIESVNFYHAMAAATNNDPAELDYVMRSLQILGRDNARLPMQWDGDKAYAGFTDSEKGPWMRVHDLFREINVARQLRVGDKSVLGFWRRMIRFRKEHAAVLVHGEFEAFGMEDEKTFVFGKKGGKDGEMRAAAVLNFSGEEQEVELPNYDGLVFAVGSYDDGVDEGAGGRVKKLRPWEGRLYLAGC
jgi:alpha-glucosidase